MCPHGLGIKQSTMALQLVTHFSQHFLSHTCPQGNKREHFPLQNLRSGSSEHFTFTLWLQSAIYFSTCNKIFFSQNDMKSNEN